MVARACAPCDVRALDRPALFVPRRDCARASRSPESFRYALPSSRQTRRLQAYWRFGPRPQPAAAHLTIARLVRCSLEGQPAEWPWAKKISSSLKVSSASSPGFTAGLIARALVGRRLAPDILLLHVRIDLTVAEVAAQLAERRTQMDDRLSVDLRDAGLRDAEHPLDFLEGQAFEVVQRDHRALLMRERVDRFDERLANFPGFNRFTDLVDRIAQRVDQRNLVALLIGQKLFEREDRGAANPLHRLIELFGRQAKLVRNLFFARRASELGLELLIGTLDFAGTLTNRARNPVQSAQGVE